MSYLVKESGYTRQWLSRLAALGSIPGAIRTSSGRWKFTNSPPFETWLATQRKDHKARMRYAIYRDVHAVHVLRQRRENAWRDHASANMLSKLQGEIMTAEANIRGYLKANEIAKMIGRSKRWITSIAHVIPGVESEKNRIVFRKSDALAAWVWRERLAKLAENRRPPRFRRSRLPPASRLLVDVREFRQVVDNFFRMCPLHVWPPPARDAFELEATELISVLKSHLTSP